MNPLLDKAQYLIRRELWENKGSVIWAPITIAATVCLLVVLVMFFGKLNIGSDGLEIDMALRWMDQYSQNVPSDEPVRIIDFNTGSVVDSDDTAIIGEGEWNMTPANIISRFQHGSAFGFELVAFFIAFVYLLGALYNDRKDRSILFWKSLPISETQNVFSKLVFAIFVIPFVAIICSIPVQLVLGISIASIFSFSESFTFMGTLAELELVRVFLIHLMLIVVFGFKTLPLYSWMLFSSAVTKKSPMLIAILLPLFIVTIETLLFDTSYLSDFIEGLFFSDRFDDQWLKPENALHGALALLNFSILQILKIVGVSAIFLSGAVWLRNNRYEI